LGVFLDILKVFQKDIPLLEVLLSITFIFIEVTDDIHSLALMNFGISLNSLRSFSSDNIIYTKTSSPILSDVGAWSNLFIF